MNIRSSALAAASGLLLAMTFPTVDMHLFAWIGLIPLFLALKKQSVKTAFQLGGITGIVYFAGTVHWVTNSVHFFGNIPLIPASLITLLLCAYLALYLALFAAAVVRLKPRYPSLVFVAAPALWTALELARTYVFSGFPWSLLGYSQYRALPVIQISDITGVYGVSFLIVLVNVSLSEFILDRRRYAGIIVSSIMLVLVLAYGYHQLRAPMSPESLSIAVVQGNIEQDKKWDPAYQAATIAVYRRLTRNALKDNPALVIWPETAMPFYFTGDNPVDRKLTSDLKEFVKENGTPLLFGSPTYELRPKRQVALRNSAFLLSKTGDIDQVYHKHHLVPFGEYVPVKKILFFVEKMVQAIGDFESGKDYTVMTIPVAASGSVEVSTVICYEIIFPDLVRRFVDNGARIVTTITNDAWFGKTAAPYQHFSMAVFRAIENRVPIARAANTGISGFIDSRGNILAVSPLFTEAVMTGRLSPGTTRTFYTSHGDLFSYACLLFSLAILLFTYKRTPDVNPARKH